MYGDDDYLFDYLLIENWELKEKNDELSEENDDLKEENEKLKNQLNGKEESLDTDIDYDIDEATYFAEDFQNIAAENWKEMEITFEEAWRAINLWFTPEEYYEYKTR